MLLCPNFTRNRGLLGLQDAFPCKILARPVLIAGWEATVGKYPHARVAELCFCVKFLGSALLPGVVGVRVLQVHGEVHTKLIASPI